jgi:hypothetical protein
MLFDIDRVDHSGRTMMFMHMALYFDIFSSFGVCDVPKHATKMCRNIVTDEAMLDEAFRDLKAGSCGPQLSLPGW